MLRTNFKNLFFNQIKLISLHFKKTNNVILKKICNRDYCKFANDYKELKMDKNTKFN